MLALSAQQGSGFRAVVDSMLKVPGLKISDDPEQVRQAIADYFDESMARVSGWYRRHVQLVLFLCGFGLAGLMNVDTLAVIRALEALKRRCTVQLHTDSKYVQQGISEWIHGWKKNGWRTSAKKPVKNDDLWKELDALSQQHDIKWLWVKGHAGHNGNERADELANRGVESVEAAR